MAEPLWGQRPNPCKGCTDRHEACWGHCRKPERLKWLEEQETIRTNRAKADMTTHYTVEQIRKNRRK